MLDVFAKSVPELLSAILPTQAHFPADGENWIFRGQGHAGWGLIPSIRREKSWEALGGVKAHGLRASSGLVISSEEELKKVERAVLHTLGEVIHRMGLPLELEQADALAAFAQHIGLPTRLLDWTSSPMMAAYFAASDAVQLDDPAFTHLVVYAASSGYIEHSQRMKHVERLRVPGYGNRTLVAQHGFLLRVEGTPYDLLDGAERLEIPCGEPLPERAAGHGDNGLLAFHLPRELSGELMCALREMGIHAGTVFPGERGVAELVREVMRTR